MTLDAIVVLGSLVFPDGSLLDMVKYRVEHGVELFEQDITPYLIFSGHSFFGLPYTPLKTEAEAMRDYAVSLGVPDEAILLEEKARNTMGNAYFTKKNVLEPRGWKNIAVVTSDFHVPKTQYLFQKILGPEYTVDVRRVAENGLPESILEKVIHHEEKNFAMMKTLLGLVPDGSDLFFKIVLKAINFFGRFIPSYDLGSFFEQAPQDFPQDLRDIFITDS